MDSDSEYSSHSSAEGDSNSHSSSETLSLEYEPSSFESESAGSSDHEVHPFMYEPVLASASTDISASEGDDDSDESALPRLLNLNWCLCGHCIIMPTGIECICCAEISQIADKTSAEEVGCIVLHPGFQGVCLDPWVLETAYYSYRQHYGENAVEGAMNEKYRHVGYRQLTRWCWQWLGKDIHVLLPSCAVTKIRSTFPSTTGVYTGFKFPSLS